MTPPGHQIVETGLIKLESATGDPRYEMLAGFFLDQRGNAAGHKLNGPINQDHLPVTQQTEAVGHAVRAAHMYAGMVDIATLENDPRYREAVEKIWDDVVSRKLYLTGAIGARHDGEAFGAAYELPNKYAYGETCASIASVYWNHRLFLQSGEAKYIDVLERTLYNGVISGLSLSGVCGRVRERAILASRERPPLLGNLQDAVELTGAGNAAEPAVAKARRARAGGGAVAAARDRHAGERQILRAEAVAQVPAHRTGATVGEEDRPTLNAGADADRAASASWIAAAPAGHAVRACVDGMATSAAIRAGAPLSVTPLSGAALAGCAPAALSVGAAAALTRVAVR